MMCAMNKFYVVFILCIFVKGNQFFVRVFHLLQQESMLVDWGRGSTKCVVGAREVGVMLLVITTNALV